jgi:hypothetical protein
MLHALSASNKADQCDAFSEPKMSEKDDTATAVVHDLPRAPNRGNLTLRELADAYMAAFTGRDSTRPYTVGFWVRELGDRRCVDIDADMIADVLDRYAAAPVTKYAGKDRDGIPILRQFGRRAPATVNRLRSVISGMLTFAQRKRLTPRGWTNPCKEIALAGGWA